MLKDKAVVGTNSGKQNGQTTCAITASTLVHCTTNEGVLQLLHAKSAPNIFTSYTNDYWKMIRKGVAPAFNPINLRSVDSWQVAFCSSVLTNAQYGQCAHMLKHVFAPGDDLQDQETYACRNGFHHIVNINMRLIEALHAATPERAVDMDNAAQRVTLDVIGRVGFDKDFGATGDLGSGSANEAFDLMGAGNNLYLCMLLVSCRALALIFAQQTCMPSCACVCIQ